MPKNGLRRARHWTGSQAVPPPECPPPYLPNQGAFAELPEGIQRVITQFSGQAERLHTALEAELRTYPPEEQLALRAQVCEAFGMQPRSITLVLKELRAESRAQFDAALEAQLSCLPAEQREEARRRILAILDS